jgi:hypothetical protein
MKIENKLYIKITLGDLLNKFDWDTACKIKGINPYCINEGIANVNDIEYFNMEEYLQLIGREQDIKYFKELETSINTDTDISYSKMSNFVKHL